MRNDVDEPKYPIEVILGVAQMGGIIVVLLFARIWADDGVITELFSGRRIAAVLAAALYGGLLGWMIYPRRPFARFMK